VIRLSLALLMVFVSINGSITVYASEDLELISSVALSTRQFAYAVYNGGVDGQIQSLGLGISGVYRRFYVDLSGERNIEASEESTDNLLETDRVNFERTDITTAAGYALTDAISIFAGYKYGQSTITALFPSPFSGAKITLSGKGPFIGAGGRWPVENWGFLSFSAAYANMEANYQDLSYGTAKGDASGTSLSVQWKGVLTSDFYYDFTLIRHDYYYQDFDKFSWDISEQILSYRVALSYRF